MIPTWLAALMAGAATIWQQIKNAISWITSIVFVQVVIEDSELVFVPYMKSAFKQLKIGTKKYSVNNNYIRSSKRKETVAYEISGENRYIKFIKYHSSKRI